MNPRALFITCFGLGHLRPAPGTWGSMPPAALAWLMLVDGADPMVYLAVLAAVALIFGAACISFGIWTERFYKEKDPSECVADETCAQCLPLMAIVPGWVANCEPGVAWSPTYAAIAVAICFVLFRILDIWKPWPGRRLEKLPYGWGVLADDLSSALYAALMVLALGWLAGGASP